ncbi:MAG: division/cell wall cluster transcriptional repressor MraZ [Oscillospiraceae bacterium]|nr:division/cell wall cluster transcriptional repressor MraZ [Oscillospiraceae bacterium]
MAEFKEFIGSAEVNMDSKGRIVLPVKYRELLGEGFHVTRGYDGCLSVYDKENWEEFRDKLLSYRSTNAAARLIQRKFLSGVEEPVPDKQGKILLSQQLRDFAGLTKEVIVAGAGNRVEIWDKQRWEEYNNGGMSIEEAAAQLDELGFDF